MALAWNKVIEKPGFKDLSIEEQKKIRDDYAKQVLAPKVKAGGGNVKEVLNDFYAETDQMFVPKISVFDKAKSVYQTIDKYNPARIAGEAIRDKVFPAEEEKSFKYSPEGIPLKTVKHNYIQDSKGNLIDYSTPEGKEQYKQLKASGERLQAVGGMKEVYGVQSEKHAWDWINKAKNQKERNYRIKLLKKDLIHFESNKEPLVSPIDVIGFGTAGLVRKGLRASGTGAANIIKAGIRGFGEEAASELTLGAYDILRAAGKTLTKDAARRLINSPASLLDVPVESIAKLSADDILQMGNKISLKEPVEKVGPVVNKLAERLDPHEVKEVYQNAAEKIDKLGEGEFAKELSSAIWRKENFGQYGSPTKIVNIQGTIDGTKSMPTYECEMNLLKDMEPLPSKQKFLEQSNRYFDQRPELKKLLYEPAVKAEHLSKIEYNNVFKELREVTKGLPKKSSERIMRYAVAQQTGGKEILARMKKKIPELTEGEMAAYDFMRAKYEELYDRLQEARKLAGRNPFPKVDNYFTFFKQLDDLKNSGANLLKAGDEVVNEFIRPNMTPFSFAKKRTKNTLPVELDAYNVFKKYLNSALENIHLSPVITKANKLQNNMYEVLEDGSKKMFNLQDKDKNLQSFLHHWSRDLGGLLDLKEISGADMSRINKLAAKANQNLVYSVLAYNFRSTILQPYALRNTWVEIGLNNMKKGLERNLSPTWRKFAMEKSNVLNSRVFESGVEEALSKAQGLSRKIGNAGIKPLQILDLETARGTWLGSFYKANKAGESLEDAIRYADDVITRTQGSAMKTDKAPISRSQMGKMLSLFQTFANADYQFLKRDVLGAGKEMSKKQVLKKFLKYLAVTETFNLISEKAGIDSPFPNPIKTLMESRENGDSTAGQALEIILDIASIHPMLGSMKYGKTIGGSALNTIQKAVDDARNKKDFDYAKFIINIIKVTGVPGFGAVPGLGQIERTLKILKQGGTLKEALTGKYPEKDKLRINNLNNLDDL